MKKGEVVLVISIIFGFILYALEVPGGLALMVLSFALLSMLYFYFGFAFFNDIRLRNIFSSESYRSVTSNKIIGAIAAGISISITVVGLLFKLMRWPGSVVMLTVGISSLTVIAIICIVKFRKFSNDYYTRILNRCVVAGALAILIMILRKAPAEDIESQQESPRKIHDSIPNFVLKHDSKNFVFTDNLDC